MSTKEKLDLGYKLAKILGTAGLVLAWVLATRDKLNAVPVLQKDVKVIRRRLSRQDQQLAYLVGVMQAKSGVPFRPQPTPEGIDE